MRQYFVSNIDTKIHFLILKLGMIFLLFICLASCKSKNNKDQANNLSQPKIEESKSQSPHEKYEAAKKKYLEDVNDPDALIWYGRRAAYLGNFEEAIKLYTTGIQLHPQDARMLRHRGHRYISTRQYDKAIADFEKAATLIEGQEDQVEPDGLPNSRNIPISTLHGNIWYHLGLAYYLKNDMDNALSAYQHRTVTEKYDDNIVSGGHWLYMILSRMGKTDEASAAIAAVTKDMDIIENQSYHKMCLFYKNLISKDELQPKDSKSSADNVLLYGLGNWHLYHKQDTMAAKKYYKELLDNGNKYSFAYLAAEADWERLFK